MLARVILAVGALVGAVALAGCARVEREVGLPEQDVELLVLGKPGRVVRRVETKQKVVALTFDDGPDAKYTPTVLRLAREKKLRLTFFLVGREIEHHPDLARQEVAEGHAIGNHTWDHPVLTFDTEPQDISELERCESEIEKVCGERTYMFRPPKGMWNDDTFLAADRLGYRIILWSVALEHRTAKTPQAMARRVIEKIGPGMIILAHDGEARVPLDRSKTMKALPILVDGIRKKGYQFVTVPELLKRGKPTLRRAGRPEEIRVPRTHLLPEQAKKETYRRPEELAAQHEHELRKGLHYSMLMRGDAKVPAVALTFDDGPHPRFTPPILAILRRYGIKATFFVVGEMAAKYPEQIQAEWAAGHLLANHTYHHVNLTQIPAWLVPTEWQACQSVIRHLTGETMQFCRPPGGHYNRKVISAAMGAGLTTVLWTDNSGDYANPGAKVIQSKVLHRIGNGGIILLHDGVQQTLDVLPQIIEVLRSRGYTFITVAQMQAERKANK